MPRYDFTCRSCGITFEAITPCETKEIPCISCLKNYELQPPILADRQLSTPAHFHIH